MIDGIISGAMSSAGGSSSQQPQPFAVPALPSSSSSAANHQSTSLQPSLINAAESQGTAAAHRQTQVQRAISPPTPAPSPQPQVRSLRHLNTSLSNASDENDDFEGVQEANGILTPTHEKQNTPASAPLLSHLLREFPQLSSKDRHDLLAHFVDMCSARELAHLSSLISPRLKVDFLSALPIEVSLQIISHLDDPRTLARASAVSRFWRSLVNDEQTWKVMCKRYHFRQVPASRSNHMLGVETPDQTMEPGTSNDTEFTSSLAGDHEPLDSSQVLGNLYEAYRARGLDPSMALSELKAIHELFLSKRLREMGIEERRRQLHALQHDNVFMDLMRDNAFATRMADANMSEEDRRFYRQLEDFVRESKTGTAKVEGADASSNIGTSSAAIRSPEAQDTATVGWLSTGPPSTRTLASASGALDSEEPQTPLAASANRYFASASSLPFRDVGRSLVSPTSRLGSMTTGLLTSLWDRTGSTAPIAGAAPSDAGDRAPSQPPSTGDHGHSAQGHNDEAEEENIEEDAVMVTAEGQPDEGQSTATASLLPPSTSSGSLEMSETVSQGGSAHRRVGASKGSRRFAPFHRSGDKFASPDVITPFPIGLGQPSSQHAGRAYATRSATNIEGAAAHTASSIHNVPSKEEEAEGTTTKRSVSMSAQDTLTRARSSKPFSYKTHFKLAYQTESNWLRGGRLLTQHVSSDDASGEGATVTSLSIDDQWIVVGMANAKIHTFDARTGLFVRTLNGHTAGVWCLSLISASGKQTSSTQRSGKGKDKVNSSYGKSLDRKGMAMDEDDDDVKPVGAYPYDNDRPLYTPTPDLNLIHHDPRPAASVFSPDMRHIELGGGEVDGEVASVHPPPQFGSWSQQEQNRGSYNLFNTLQASRSNVSLPSLHSRPHSATLPPQAAVEAAAAARASKVATSGPTGTSAFSSSRGAGLGSNFGSPCGSVAGYGNERAIVVSSGCDRDVRVWDLHTGECKYVLSGHRSTVRCLRVFEGRPIAISGSRDGTMRVWNVETGQLQHLLPGHQHSVRCIDLAGNLVASASYDSTARIWNVDTGKCLHVLRGHFHQLYAIAFDGVHVATGSLDTTVRIWSAETGECLATLQGHQSLVGQLQLTDSTLITGGSDGKVIVFSLKTMKMVYQLLAHDNSVTCLQFDDRFIVTGGNDGKVKLWNFRTGEFVRELCESSGQVWKVAFRDDKCVVLCRRNEKTSMDVISFRPIEENA